MERHFLYIALDFPPLNSSGTYRNAKFVKYIGRCGWQPVVVTLDWHREHAGDHLDDELLNEIPATTTVARFPHFHPVVRIRRLFQGRTSGGHPGSHPVTLSEVSADVTPRSEIYKAARRFYHAALMPVGDMFFYWSVRMLPRCMRLARKHKVKAIFVSVSPWTTALLGVWLKKLLRLPLVVDFRDYWTMWAVKGELTWRDPLDARAEKWVLRHADLITCVHHAMAADFVQLEPSCAGRCRVITNGYDPDDFKTDLPASQAHTRCPRIVHTGIAWGDAAMPFLRALAEFKKLHGKDPLRAHFIGGLPESSLQYIKDHNLDGLVQIDARVTHAEAIRHMRESDVLLLLIVDNEGGRKWYPGKMFEYMVAQKPILAVVPEGIAAQLIREAGVGLTVDPGDTERMVTVLGDLATGADSFRQRYYHPNHSVIEQFNRVALTQKLASVLDAACAAGST